MLSNTGYESWENPLEYYIEKEFDECYAEELRHNKKSNYDYNLLLDKEKDTLPF